MNINSIKQLTKEVINGDESALKVYATLKNYSKELEVCIESIKSQALEEAETYEKNFTKDGFAFEKRNGSKRWDFKALPEWAEKKAELKAIEDKAKIAYSAYENNLHTADEDGEVSELPKVSYNSDSLIVKAESK